ncbi:hypothetical protein TWF694_008701 [Orbilia ellipsospora]|uniref:Uncharacterized protein n=1 Tax=Orbilia ellipsospora TaxID=2528407 RepID=A0AAV9XCQ8_9PEZI
MSSQDDGASLAAATASHSNFGVAQQQQRNFHTQYHAHHAHHAHHHHHHQPHPRDHHHHHHNVNRQSSSDEESDDVFPINLPRDDVESILSPSISRSQSSCRHSALAGPLTSDGPTRDAYPPKKAFFASQGKTGGLGVLSQTKLFRPRSSSVGNAEQAAKDHGEHDKWVSKLPSFNLPSIPLPQIPSFGSNAKDGTDRDKNNTRSKRAGSIIMDSLAKAAAGMSTHFSTSGPANNSNLTTNPATLKKAPPPPRRSPNQSPPIVNQDFVANITEERLLDEEQIMPKPPSLRRSNSDSSSIRRTISRTSSIGSDTRFLDVREQTNSRYKAIKDSILPDIKDSFTFSTPSLVKKATSGSLANLIQEPDPLDKLSGDVVIMGGYRGSILKKVKMSLTTPGERRIGRTLWIPVKVGFNLQNVDLEVPLDPEAEILMEEKVVATDMLSNLAGVDISRRLIRKLRTNPKVRLHVFAYDWRLSPRLNSEKLVAFMTNLPCNRMVTPKPDIPGIGELWHDEGPFVIAHSLGGLITRHAVNQRPDLFRCGGVLYAGVPQRCVNILGPIRYGDSVAFNKSVLNAQVNFSFRSSFVFLPEDGRVFVDKKTGEDLPIDFYDAAVWEEYNLSPCVSTSNKVTQSSSLLSTATEAVASVLREGKDVKEKLSRWSPSSPSLVFGEGGARKGSPREDGFLNSFSLEVPDTIGTHANEVQDIAATGAGVAAPNMTTLATNSQTGCTLPLSVTKPYLKATLAETKKFRAELAFQPSLSEQYPPFVVLYSKATPTVKAAKVNGLEGIKTTNFNDLVFGAGDGVVLAREAMLPPGYICEKRVHCDRGHISLLGDLDATGQCIAALLDARERNKRRLMRTLGRNAPPSA